MYPILLDLGRIKLHSYGLAMAVAFGLGIWLAVKRAEARGLGSKFAVDLSVWIIIWSLIGARFTYVVTHVREYADYPLDIISPIQHTGQIGYSGLVLLGGVLAGFATVWFYARRHGHDFLDAFDLFIPSLTLGIAIGRLGCFFNGCCFGLPTALPWCVQFPEDSLAGSVFPGQCLHPTQLYETAFMLVIFAGLLLYGRRPRPMGRLTGWFLLSYGVARFLNEGLRWYEKSMILFQSDGFRFTFSRLISILMIAAGVGLLFSRNSRRLAG